MAMLTAGALMTPAKAFAIDAGELPSGGTVVGGDASFDYSQPNKLDVHQNTDRVVIDWDSFNIGTDATTQFYQPGSDSLAVNRVYSKGLDPTQILGKLIANGKVMVLDRNGVIFGQDSVVDVGGIIASTGDINIDQVMSGSNKIDISNISDAAIINNGLINVQEAGLAGLVAKTAINNGVIKAKVGRVSLASGEKATVDLYGDNLIEIAADSNLETALVSNSGQIIAEGGTVQLTASAAKNAVDNVVNMDGIVDVSSVEVKGGKIILGGGNSTVKVSGKLKADGKTGGGKIDVKGKNITVTEDAEISANGEGARVDFIAADNTDFRGTLTAKGGDVEISGKGSLGFTGLVDADTLLLDPTWALIHSGLVNNPLGLKYILSAQSLANSMKNGTTITVQADNFIDVGTSGGSYNTGDSIVDAALNALIGTGDIDLSTWSETKFNFPSCIFGCTTTGTTAGNIKFDTATLNLNKNLILGNGGVTVDASTLNLKAKITNKAGALLADGKLTGTSKLATVNVGSNGKIQQGINFADDANALTTINLAASTYTENLNINKSNVKLVGVTGTTIQAATGGDLVRVTGSDVTIDPIVFDGLNLADNGINAIGVSNFIVDGNTFQNFLVNGIRVENGSTVGLTNNTVKDIASGWNHSGINIAGGSDILIDNNTLTNVGGQGIYAEGPYAGPLTTLDITNNEINGTEHNAIYVKKWNGADIEGNEINGTTYGNGIQLELTTGANVVGNTVVGAAASGVNLYYGNDGTKIQGNTLTSNKYGVQLENVGGGNTNTLIGSMDSDAAKANIITGGTTGILVNGGSNLWVQNNDISGASDAGIDIKSSAGAYNIINYNKVNSTNDGIRVADTTAVIADNRVGLVGALTGNGIFTTGGDNTEILANQVSNTAKDGIKIEGGNGIKVQSNNQITNAGRVGIYSDKATNLLINGNTITGATFGIGSNYGAVTVETGSNATVSNNKITNSTQGVRMYNVGGVNNFITGNTINTVTNDGVYVIASGSVEVLQNKIGTGTDGILNNAGDTSIGGNGVTILSSSDAVVDGNKIGHAQNGVYADNAGNLWVHDNDIADAKVNGIYVKNSDGTNYVNDIDIWKNRISASTLATGIRVENSAYATVGVHNNNQFGQPDGYTTGNVISGVKDGIVITGSANSMTRYNTVSNISGTGIDLTGSNGSKINDNKISDAAGNGIGVSSGNNISIERNTVTDVAHAGIYSRWTPNILVNSNTVNGTGEIGIYSINSNGGVIRYTNNTVDNTGLDGIRINSAGNAIISGNDIGLAVGSVIGRDGIRVTSSNGTEISGNDVANTVRHGIYSSYSDGVIINANTANNTGNAAIYLLESTNTDVTNNDIGLVVGSTIKGDGIRAETSAGATITGNDVANTIAGGATSGTGINLIGSSNSVVSDNTVTNGIWDGIAVTSSDNISVERNVVTNVARSGIYSIYTPNILVNQNTVNGAGNIGIYANNSNGGIIRYTNNIIDNVTLDGIRVQSADNAIITGNDIGLLLGSTIGRDGIRIQASNGTEISGNDVANASRYGIYSAFSNDVLISANEVDTVGNDGIRVANSLFAEILDNLVSNAAVSGIHIGDMGAGTAVVAGNEVTDSTTGMTFESGFIDLTGDANTITGGDLGFLFSPAAGNSVNLVGNTIGTTIFETPLYITLANGALYNPGTPTVIDATNASFNGFIPSSVNGLNLTQDQYDFVENGIYHFNDLDTLGLFFFGFQPGIDQSDLFRQIADVPGIAGRFNITIRGLPRIAGVTVPNAPAGNTGFSLNDITPAAGEDDEQQTATNQNPQNIEPAAGASENIVEATSWNSAIDAASQGQIVNYSFSGDGSDIMSSGL